MLSPRPGKTLIEVLVVVAVVAVLVGLLLAAVQKVRRRADRLRDENNTRQVGLAAHGYQTQHGRLPPLVGLAGLPTGYHQYPVPVAALLLTHLEQPSPAVLWMPQPADEPLFVQHVVPAYVSPSDPSHTAGRVVWSDGMQPGVGNIAFNVQVFGPKLSPCGEIDGKASLSNTFPDGTSNTLLLAGKRGKCGPPDRTGVAGGSWWAFPILRGRRWHCGEPMGTWLTSGPFFGHVLPAADGTGPTFQVMPSQDDCDPDLAQGLHSGGMTGGMADGSVRTVRADLDPKLWRAGLLPNDGAGLPPD